MFEWNGCAPGIVLRISSSWILTIFLTFWTWVTESVGGRFEWIDSYWVTINDKYELSVLARRLSDIRPVTILPEVICGSFRKFLIDAFALSTRGRHSWGRTQKDSIARTDCVRIPSLSWLSRAWTSVKIATNDSFTGISNLSRFLTFLLLNHKNQMWETFFEYLWGNCGQTILNKLVW